MNEKSFQLREFLTGTIIVAALGYFVDIYDLILFSIVRKPSLLGIGVAEANLQSTGLWLINIQMIGMLIGGIIWGVFGDKKGRLSVLFGSILLYSLANIANGFVHSVTQYAVLRFIAGVGLAGELGAGITLVAESLPKEKRGFGAMIVATIGLLGAVFAGLMGLIFQNNPDGWRICYFIGGGLGLLLLFMRIGLFESGMYQQMEADEEVKRGDFLMVFKSKERFVKFIKCVVIGFPIWYSIGILVTLSPEFTKAIGVVGKVQMPIAIMLYYLGASIGDVLCGFGSHFLKSRKKIILIYILAIALVLVPFFLAKGMPINWYYVVVFFLGMGGGYWAILMTIATESFGTNLRATVTTTVPNFIRGSLTLITLLFTGLQTYFKPNFGGSNALIWAGILTGVVCLGIPLLTIRSMEETFGKDLNYHEKD